MRRRGPLRPLALAVVVAAVLAVGVAGCGREGELVQTPAATPPSTATTRTAPAATTPSVPAATTPAAPAATTPTEPGTRTTATTARPHPSDDLPAADARLRATAAAYVRRRLGLPARPADITLRRSQREPRWAITSGFEDDRLWVVWLRDGAVALATKDPARFAPPAVPCDLRPAFSAPSC